MLTQYKSKACSQAPLNHKINGSLCPPNITTQMHLVQVIRSLLHFGTEQELEQGTATGDIAAGNPPSALASSVPALNLPTPDGPALSNPTPDGFPPSPDNHFLPPPGWLESPDPSLQIVAALASPISVVAASESSSDVVVLATTT